MVKDVQFISFNFLPSKYNFWKDVTYPGRPVDLMVSQKKQKSFLESLNNSTANVTVYIDDVQEFFAGQTASTTQKSRLGRRGIYKRGESKSPGHFDWTNYHKLDEIYNWMKHLRKVYPDNVETFVVGETFEKRKILGLKISTALKKNLNKSAVFIEGGIHAREWISPAVVTYVIKKVLWHKNDNKIREALPLFDWYFVPVLNPDGYEYTFNEVSSWSRLFFVLFELYVLHFKNHRLWRKNKSYNRLKNPLKAPECIGVDLNRNWDFKWRGIRAVFQGLWIIK